MRGLDVGDCSSAPDAALRAQAYQAGAAVQLSTKSWRPDACFALASTPGLGGVGGRGGCRPHGRAPAASVCRREVGPARCANLLRKDRKPGFPLLTASPGGAPRPFRREDRLFALLKIRSCVLLSERVRWTQHANLLQLEVRLSAHIF
jgi:hypothetical protein